MQDFVAWTSSLGLSAFLQDGNNVLLDASVANSTVLNILSDAAFPGPFINCANYPN
jgi:hypothetical protein